MSVRISDYQHMLGISDEEMVVYKLKYGDIVLGLSDDDMLIYKLRYGNYMTVEEFAKEIGDDGWAEILSSRKLRIWV